MLGAQRLRRLAGSQGVRAARAISRQARHVPGHPQPRQPVGSGCVQQRGELRQGAGVVAGRQSDARHPPLHGGQRRLRRRFSSSITSACRACTSATAQKNNGRSTPFGEGDAPIIEVLRMIRDNKWPIVALLEFEHGTLRPEVEEVQLMFDYCKRAVRRERRVTHRHVRHLLLCGVMLAGSSSSPNLARRRRRPARRLRHRLHRSAAGRPGHAAREGDVRDLRLRVLPRRQAEPRGEAADLMHSALVGADVNGNAIGPLLRPAFRRRRSSRRCRSSLT